MEPRIAVLMAVDEAYAGPLCVTVGSLLAHLRPGVGLDLFVMEAGLAAGTRARLARAFDHRVRLQWLVLDDATQRLLRRLGHAAAPAANFRMLAGSQLPAALAKVLYLDADLLVRRDVGELWERDMRGAIVLAVQDSYIQTLPAQCLAKDHAASASGAPRPYFNSGVMLIDLDAWRAADIEARALAAAERLRYRTRWLDQEALNAALVGRWAAVPPLWNKQFALTLFPDWECSPHDAAEFRQAVDDPAIVHFSSTTKPWHAFCDHPPEDVGAYRAVLRSSAFADACGEPPTRLRRWREHFFGPHRRVLDGLAAALRTRRRRHALRVMLPGIARATLRHPWTAVSVPLAIGRERLGRRLAGRTASR